MNRISSRSLCLVILCTAFLLTAATSAQQITTDDYQRAGKLRERFQDLAVDIPETPNAIPNTNRFWYRKSVKGGHEFVLVDAQARSKKPAFDHSRLATSLSAVAGGQYTLLTLPFTTFRFIDGERSIEFDVAGNAWQCDLQEYVCKAAPQRPGSPARGSAAARPPEEIIDENPQEYGNDVYDGMVDLTPQSQAPPQGLQVPGQEAAPRGNTNPKASPDGKWEAVVLNYNVIIRPKGSTNSASIPLTFDGSEGNYYTLSSIVWSPDSMRLAAYRVRPGYRRQIHYVE